MRTHIVKTHPHAEAAYRILSNEDGSFGAEVSIPSRSYPVRVGPFPARSDAEGGSQDTATGGKRSEAGSGLGKRGRPVGR
jgi:hypothetical protein